MAVTRSAPAMLTTSGSVASTYSGDTDSGKSTESIGKRRGKTASAAYRQESRCTSGFTRSIAELEAESVACVVSLHFGLHTEVRPGRHITLWDGDSKAVRASLQRIANTARGIIDDLEALETRKAVA